MSGLFAYCKHCNTLWLDVAGKAFICVHNEIVGKHRGGAPKYHRTRCRVEFAEHTRSASYTFNVTDEKERRIQELEEHGFISRNTADQLRREYR